MLCRRPHLSLLAPLVSLAVGVGLAPPAAAVPPSYATFELAARANFAGAFRLPDSAFFANTTPRLNAGGDIAFDLEVLPSSTSQGVWLGSTSGGSIVHTTVADAFVLSVGLNDLGEVVWDEAFSSPDGLYRYLPGVGAGFLTNVPFGATSWGSPGINANGVVGYRAGFAGSGQAWVSYDGSPTVAIHAAEAGLVISSPYSFLFTPSFNNQRQIAGKVRLGAAGQLDNSRPDEIRVFAADGSSVSIAQDHDANAASPYSGFDNAVSLRDDGWVAFIATLVAGGRGVYLSDGTMTIEIATEAGPQVSSIEFFAPTASPGGLVAFRAFDAAGLRAVWVGDGTGLVPVVKEHDILPTDLGPARVDQNDSSPVFAGGIELNAGGDLSFAATLTPPDDNQIEWGTGVFVALATAPEPIFADGFETGDTAAWSLTVPGA